jgi:tetratricopeptide (TPR) repeat protein
MKIFGSLLAKLWNSAEKLVVPAAAMLAGNGFGLDGVQISLVVAGAALAGVDWASAIASEEDLRKFQSDVLQLLQSRNRLGKQLEWETGEQIAEAAPDDPAYFERVLLRWLQGEFRATKDSVEKLRLELQQVTASAEHFFDTNPDSARALLASVLSSPSRIGDQLGDDLRRVVSEFNRLSIRLSDELGGLHRAIDANAASPEMGLLVPLPDEQANRFVYSQRRTPLTGRPETLKSLRRFLSSPETPGLIADFRWMLLVASGGSGKSRTAFELCLEAESRGWHAGFLSHDSRFSDWHRWHILRPTLLVVDYVSERPEQIRKALIDLSLQASHIRAPLRILLLERSADSEKDEWLKRFLPVRSEIAAFFQFGYHASTHSPTELGRTTLSLSDLTPEDAWAIMEAVWDQQGPYHLARDVRPSPATVMPLFEQIDRLRRPLFAALVAEAIATRGLQQLRQWRSISDIVGHILEGEVVRWMRSCRALAVQMDDDTFRTEFESHLNLVLAASVSRQKLPVQLTVLRRSAPATLLLPKEVRTSWTRAIAGLSGTIENEQVVGLEPDILAELLFLERLGGRLTLDSRNQLEQEQAHLIGQWAWASFPLEFAEFTRRCIDDFYGHASRAFLVEQVIDLTQPIPHSDHRRAIAYAAIADVLCDVRNVDRTSYVERAIRAYESASQVLVAAGQPLLYAAAQRSLGTAFARVATLPLDERKRLALGHLSCALAIHERLGTNSELAMDHAFIGIAYHELSQGDRGDIQNAIQHTLTVEQLMPRNQHPLEWALAQMNLGVQYQQIGTVEAKREALRRLDAALEVFTIEVDGPTWARLQANRGVVLRELERVDGQYRLHEAIAAYGQALRVYTRGDAPGEWARVQHNLGAAYAALRGGDEDSHSRSAEEYFNKALEVTTREASPFKWAHTKNQIAQLYLERKYGKRRDNLCMAIALCDEALCVRTVDTAPLEHARSMFTRGQCLWAMSSEGIEECWDDATTNIRRAIEVFGSRGAEFERRQAERILDSISRERP